MQLSINDTASYWDWAFSSSSSSHHQLKIAGPIAHHVWGWRIPAVTTIRMNYKLSIWNCIAMRSVLFCWSGYGKSYILHNGSYLTVWFAHRRRGRIHVRAIAGDHPLIYKIRSRRWKLCNDAQTCVINFICSTLSAIESNLTLEMSTNNKKRKVQSYINLPYLSPTKRLSYV